MDTAGRALGEQAATTPPPAALMACPFHDSRRGQLMNTTAYRQVESHWNDVLDGLRATTGPTAGDAWRACCRLRWIPLALPDPLDETVAARFKTALGLGRPLSSWLLLNPGAAARPLHELVSVDDLPKRLEDEGWLHGAHQVCAGPMVRIQAAWQALAEPRPADLPGVDVADAAMDLVVGLWAVLGATRTALREGLDGAPGWSWVGDVDPDWPTVLRLLRLDGPGALVREVPRFEPEWALHVYAEPPEAVVRVVSDARDALDRDRPLVALDEAWERLYSSASTAAFAP